jgi:predicted restriction endonuclease
MRPQAAYCSMSCKSTGHSRKLTGRILYGKNSPSTFRKAIRAKFLDRCAVCGWDEAPCDVAHIVPGVHEFENVVMLCPNHHRLFDRGQISPDEVRAARVTILR